jgi:hypothetical protein
MYTCRRIAFGVFPGIIGITYISMGADGAPKLE